MSYPEVEVPTSWIESNLDKKWLDMDSVVSIEEEAGIKKGENFGSVMRRVKITGLAKDGTTVSRKMMMKKDRIIPAESAMPIFHTEIQTYSEILPEMKKIIDEYSTSDSNIEIDTLWPICFGIRKYDVLLFEDLQERGFEMRNRTQPMSLNEANLIISNLAKFHAVSLAAINRKAIDPKTLSPYLHTVNGQYLNTLWLGGLTTLADVILESDNEWSCLVPKLRELAGTAGDEMEKLPERVKDTLHVICHGDCHSNNMLFKFSNDSEVTSVMFLDYQLTHYNSFTWDLVYLLHMGLPAKDREKYCKPLIENYRRSLVHCLEALEQNTFEVPPVERIHNIMDELWLFGFLLATCLYPVLANTTDKMWEGDKAIENNGYSLPREAFENSVVKESLKIDLLKFKNKYLL